MKHVSGQSVPNVSRNTFLKYKINFHSLRVPLLVSIVSYNHFEELLELIRLVFISRDKIDECHRKNATGTRVIIRVENCTS
jgi:hypothetical protein